MYSLSSKNFIVKSDAFAIKYPPAADLRRTFANAPGVVAARRGRRWRARGLERVLRLSQRRKGRSTAKKGGGQGGRPKLHLDL